MKKIKKPTMMKEKWWNLYVDFSWWEINLIEWWDELWHYLWDVTEDCVRSVLKYWAYMAKKLEKNKVQFSHPCSDWLIEVRKKKKPLKARLISFYLYIKHSIFNF